jgi:hypothetical protein
VSTGQYTFVLFAEMFRAPLGISIFDNLVEVSNRGRESGALPLRATFAERKATMGGPFYEGALSRGAGHRGVETWGSSFNTDPVFLPEGGVETGG